MDAIHYKVKEEYRIVTKATYVVIYTAIGLLFFCLCSLEWFNISKESRGKQNAGNSVFVTGKFHTVSEFRFRQLLPL